MVSALTSWTHARHKTQKPAADRFTEREVGVSAALITVFMQTLQTAKLFQGLKIQS